MGYIYKITNDINNKLYIGKTEKENIQERWKNHCKDYKKRQFEKRPLYRAMNKYGIEHFHIEEIEYVAPNQDLEERETYWINYYNTYHNGYNATLGGDGKHYLDYDLIISTYKTNYNCSKTAKIIGCSKDAVIDVVKKYGFSPQGGKANSIPVVQLDKKTNQILNIFPSAVEAEKATGIQNHINAVCKGKRQSAGGFKWRYATQEEIQLLN